MKYCSKCKQNLDELDFYKNPTKKDGLAESCKSCWKIYRKQHYINNKQYYLDKAKKYENKIKILYNQYKQKQKCQECGESDYRCLDFHHIDSKTKKFNISSYQGYSKKSLMEEISKCIILCANCHRKEHKPH